jgi:hypothetical protein
LPKYGATRQGQKSWRKSSSCASADCLAEALRDGHGVADVEDTVGLVVVGVTVGVGVGVNVGVVVGLGVAVGSGVGLAERVGVDVDVGGDWTGRTKPGPVMWRPVSISTMAAPATTPTTIAPPIETPVANA